MKADPERPEQIAERIVFEEWAYTVSQPAKLIETIAAAIHAERAQTARLREHIAGCFHCQERGICEEAEELLREAAEEDRSHE